MMAFTSQQDNFDGILSTSSASSAPPGTTLSTTIPATVSTTESTILESNHTKTTTSQISPQVSLAPVPVSHPHHHHHHHHHQSSSDSKKKRMFSKELRCMMYGFGDDQNPYTETVDMLEDLVIQFIGDISLKALEIGRSGRVTVEDVMYLVRRDQRKYSRVKDLLSMNEELKKARKAFDEVKYVQSV